MKPLVLIVMDGWGINPKKQGNATAIASTPNLKRLTALYPATQLLASGSAVGLPEGQMGNSEVGHLTIGAGRAVFQELTRINKAIVEGRFDDNHALNKIMDDVLKNSASLHLMGLISDGGVHSHITHLYAILKMARKKGLDKVYIHAFLDGRDTPPESSRAYMESLVLNIKSIGVGSVSTIAGRYYAMDRDNRWDRVKKAYEAIVEGKGVTEDDPIEAVKNAYARGQTDEFVMPIVMTKDGKPVAVVNDGDGVMFFNFRSDRARELTRAFVEEDFTDFERRKRLKRLCGFVTMTEYDARFNLPVVFSQQNIKNILPWILSEKGIIQLRVAETEKYAHVTFFFNGGRERPFPGEERVLVPSVKDVPTYDKKPEMRAGEIADRVVEKLKGNKFGFILVNFANGDMVGHTGVMDAAVKAVEAVDRAVGKVADAALNMGFCAIITSDHGNVEEMIDYATLEPLTAHTLNPVPFILVDESKRGVRLKNHLGLSSVAPTILTLMGIQIPPEMAEALL